MNADLKAVIGGVIVGAIGWFALLSWSFGEVDPSRGPLPWALWQMIVFGVIIACGAVFFTVRERLAIGVSYAFAVTLTAVALFIITVRAGDVTGLFVVGAFMLGVGIMTLLVATCFITAGVQWLSHRQAEK